MNALLFILKEENILQKIFRAMQEQAIPLIIPSKTLEIPNGRGHSFTFDEHPIFAGHINLFLLLSKCREDHPSIQAWDLGDLCETIAPEIDKFREERWNNAQKHGTQIPLLGRSTLTTEYQKRVELLRKKFEAKETERLKGIQTISSDAIEHEERRY